MKTDAKVSEKGQVTIPKAVRERLGVRAGDVLDFSAEGGQIVARKRASRSAVDEVYGILNIGMSTDEMISELRGDVDE
jgi:AbrB family looped-hinge helix DNA binding protein